MQISMDFIELIICFGHALSRCAVGTLLQKHNMQELLVFGLVTRYLGAIVECRQKTMIFTTRINNVNWILTSYDHMISYVIYFIIILIAVPLGFGLQGSLGCWVGSYAIGVGWDLPFSFLLVLYILLLFFFLSSNSTSNSQILLVCCGLRFDSHNILTHSW